jgi:hypothetical protein
MTDAASALSAVLLVATAAGGCSGGSLTNADGSSTVSLSPAPCGGTVAATGTTPAGSFDGTLLSTIYDGCMNGVGVWIGDASSGLVFTVWAPFRTTDGGAPIVPGDAAARGELDRSQPPAVIARTSGTMTVTAADFLPSDATLGGQVNGSFQFSQDGFALSGTFSSPYCRHLTLCSD